jgi:hypothetical protein
MAGGKGKIRPEDGIQFSKEYQPEEKWTEQKALELGQELLTWMKAKDKDGEDKGNIFFEDFLLIENDYYDDLTDYLKNKFTSFSVLLASAKRIQEIKLKKFGVGDRLNATMTKFVLTNNHGYSDQTKTVNENINHNIELTPERAKEVKKIFDADY